jgi:tellurite resistance protein
MVSTVSPRYTNEQITAWLRGLLTIAWADGNYEPQEQKIIADLTRDLALDSALAGDLAIRPEELATQLGKEASIGENFLRTAVLVAIADGVYSSQESSLLYQFRDALGVKVEALESLEHTVCKIPESSGSLLRSELVGHSGTSADLLDPLKNWLDDMKIEDPRLARFICKMVPSQCPFERDIVLFGRKIVHIPPLCKLNPLYEQLVGLRFRSLSYLADDCQEDVSEYI